MSDLNEEQIIELIKDGKLEYYDQIIRKYQDKVFRYSYSKLGNYDDALEAAQEIFISVFKSLKNFRGESKFSTWLYSITSNYCKNHKRKGRRMNLVPISKTTTDGDEATVIPIVDEREDLEKRFEIDNAYEIATEELQKLPDDYRDILVLRDVEGYTYDQISEMLGISLSNVKVRIHRGRSMLKQRLYERGIV